MYFCENLLNYVFSLFTFIGRKCAILVASERNLFECVTRPTTTLRTSTRTTTFPLKDGDARGEKSCYGVELPK